MSSNSHITAIENKANLLLQWGDEFKTNGNMIQFWKCMKQYTQWPFRYLFLIIYLFILYQLFLNREAK